MSSGKNIAAAFTVVRKTHESIYNLFSYLQSETVKRGEFEMMHPLNKFLRWNSDGDCRTWAYDDFMLLFQNKNDAVLENDWRDGPLYVFEINLRNYDEPQVTVSRFDYENMGEWYQGSSPSHHGGYYDPLYKEGVVNFDVDNETFFSGTAVPDKANQYWGLKRVKGYYIPLTHLTAENAYEKVIGGFKSLAELN
jgi:hypothetical protein